MPNDTNTSSKAATLAAAVGVGGPAVTLVGIALVQLGAAPMVGFGLFQLGILFGLGGLICGAIGLYTTRGPLAGRSKAVLGLGLGVLMVAVVAVSAAPGADVPPINDITTNLDDPPHYAPAPDGHANAGRDMSYPPDFAAQVRAAYPDLAPITLPHSRDDAYRLAKDAALELGWKITHEDPAAGTFEAADTTAVFRFVDDVSVRVRNASAGHATLDIRSKSRDGRGDLGANATRIRAFTAALNQQP